MTEIEGDLFEFIKARGDVMAQLLRQVGPSCDIVRHELQPKVGNPVARTFLNYLVDEHGRALACMAEVMDPPRMEIVVAIYTEPRAGYADHRHPLLEQLPHSTLN